MSNGLPERTATILFTDIVESTALTERLGDRVFRAASRTLDEAMRAAMRAAGGTPVDGKVLGDGVMAVFSSASQAIAAARRCVELSSQSELRLHVGLHAGDVTHEGGNVFGGAVNIASRICGLSAPGEVLVSATVRELARTSAGVTFADRGEHALKGIDDAIRVYDVHWREEPPSPLRLAAGGVPFVRRNSEITLLKQALDRASAGDGSLVLIGGEAGVGKTRLAEEGAAEARRRGFLVFTGHCYEDASSPPYGPFVEILEAAARSLPSDARNAAFGDTTAAAGQIAPGLWPAGIGQKAATEQPSFTRQSIFTAFHEILKCASGAQALLLVLDDLQWADDSSLQLLLFLARSLHALPIAIVGTHREVVLDADSSFEQTQHELHVKRLVVEIALKPFGVADVEALLQAASGSQPPRAVVRLLQAETSGNAFFIEELYQHLAEEGQLFDEGGAWRPARRIDDDALPKGIRLVVERRLGRLSAASRRALDQAAIFGASFDIDLLDAAGTEHGDQLLDCLDEAERGRIIVPESDGADGRLRFAHPITRAVIVAALSSSRRQRLNLRAADAIETQTNRSRALDAELAYHYKAGGRLADPRRSIAAFRRAGDAAHGTYANTEAAAHFDAALKIAERLPSFGGSELADLVHARGQTQYRLGEWERSRASLDRALSLYREAGDGPGEARALYSKSSLATFDSNPSEALELLAQARDLTPEDEPRRGLILQLEAQNLVDIRQYADAKRAADEALAIAERHDDAGLRNHALLALGYVALATLDMTGAVEAFSRVSEAAVALPHERMAAESRRAIALTWRGDLDEAEERGTHAHAYFQSMRDDDDVFGDPGAERDPYEFGLSCLAEATSAIVRGRLAEAYRFLGEAIEETGDPPNLRVVRTLAPMIVQILHYLGRYDEAATWLRRFAGPVNGRETAFARLYAALEAVAREVGTGAASVPAPPPHRPDIQSLAVMVLAAETAVGLRDADAARLQLDALEYLQERGMLFSSGWVALVPRLLGAVYTLTGNELRAAPALEAALAVSRSRGADSELAMTHLELAELHAVRGNAAAARTDLAEAERVLAALAIRCCDARLRELKERLQPAERPAPVLSEQETNLLRLVAEGLTNRAIAENLSLREGAVQRRLVALYARIGVENRVAAIAYAYRRGIARGDE